MPSGSRAACDHVRPPSSDVISMPHQSRGRRADFVEQQERPGFGLEQDRVPGGVAQRRRLDAVGDFDGRRPTAVFLAREPDADVGMSSRACRRTRPRRGRWASRRSSRRDTVRTAPDRRCTRRRRRRAAAANRRPSNSAPRASLMRTATAYEHRRELSHAKAQRRKGNVWMRPRRLQAHKGTRGAGFLIMTHFVSFVSLWLYDESLRFATARTSDSVSIVRDRRRGQIAASACRLETHGLRQRRFGHCLRFGRSARLEIGSSAYIGQSVISLLCG